MRRALVVVSVLLAGLCAAACGPAVDTFERDGLTLHRTTVGVANVYLVEAEGGVVVVDVGEKGHAQELARALEAVGLRTDDVTLVIGTHGHFDHIGAGKDVQQLVHAPFAVGEADAVLAREGLSLPPRSLIWEGEVARPFLDPYFPAFEPDVLIDVDGLDLGAFGVPGAVARALPGHTPGSVAVVLPSGDALVGDMVRGTDTLEGGQATTHLYSDDFAADDAHLAGLVHEGIGQFFPGHGPDFDADSLARWLDGDAVAVAHDQQDADPAQRAGQR